MQGSRRYESIDAWRGLAALSVLVFHCGNTIVGSGSPAGRLLLAGWLGVFIFFPISGYCILAALSSPHNRTIGGFLKRRWRRIVPPYWASVALSVGVGLAALRFNRGSADDLALSFQHWASVLTLTQVFTPARDSINPVYWSLCYEEQFYLVMAALVAVPRRRRAAAITAVTAAAALYLSPVWRWRLDGLFLDYWLSFAPGCAAYLWIHHREARGWAAATGVVAAATGMLQANTALLISVGTAAALTALAPHDAALARTRVGALLMTVGTFSFSLYLTHVPIGGRVTNLLHRFDLPVALIVAVSSAVSLAAAWVFFLAVEKRTLTVRSVESMRARELSSAAA